MNHVYRIIWSDASATYIAVPETASCRGKRSPGKRTRSWRSLALGAALLTAGSALAGPGGGQVSAGQGSIGQSGPVTTISQVTPKIAINWQGFNIAAGETVNFIQPGSNAVALNRVLGTDGTQILGSLNANGQVFVLNPNGILFGKGAQVSVGALVASTLSLSDADFMAGKMGFAGRGGSVSNAGSIVARGDGDRGGYVALLGGQVGNDGTITAKMGSVALGAGQQVTLDFNGDGMLKLAVDKGLADALVANRGLLKADGGAVLMTARSADALRASVVNNAGVVEARSLENHAGVIRLAATQVLNTGRLDAAGDADANGGTIAIEAGYFAYNGGSLDAGGAQGGRVSVDTHNLLEAGHIDARGRTQGGGIVISADNHLEQTSASLLRADSDSGQGGTIRIESGADAWLSGSATANGGSGRGGEIAMTAPGLVLAGAQLSATGSAGGGRIRLGGGWQGQDAELTNAQRTRVVASRIDASAGSAGDGGTVVLWSDKETLFGGEILAAGGAAGGDGGKVEVSSRGQLNFGGKVDVRASAGKDGTLLLDPKNIEIVDQVTGTLVLPLQDPNATPTANEGLGSGEIIELRNGGTATDTVVVASSLDSIGASLGGAVRMYSTQTGLLAATLVGTSANDQIGRNLVALTNGNYVVVSPSWSGGGAASRGAVTWGSGQFGVSGAVSSNNSWIGSAAGDQVGSNGVTALANGHFVIASSQWDNASLANVGAVTWVNGGAMSAGVVSTSNSLYGAKANDAIGSGGLTALTNGNYVVFSPSAANGAVNSAGAVTLLDGAAATNASVSTTNSLMGSTSGDFTSGTVTALRNGNAVVGLPLWNLPSSTVDVGAVSWINGSLGAARNAGALGSGIGTVSAGNSLVGVKTNDMQNMKVTPLEPPAGATDNAAYVVAAPKFDSTLVDAGAVSLVNGDTGSAGQMSSSNSLLGAKAGDQLGSGGIVALTNGHYLIVSPNWQGASNLAAGAVTWRSASAATSGTLAAGAAGLIGTAAGDMSNVKVTPLVNGNYVVATPGFDFNGNVDAGAVTWGNGALGTSGSINPTISIIGSIANDQVGSGGVAALANGNYVFLSPNADVNNVVDAGAIVVAGGNSATAGGLSVLAKTAGQSAGDRLGEGGVLALTNGGYVVSSPSWHNASNVAVGAVTWGNGRLPPDATVSTGNSLVGATAGDLVGANIVALAKGDYLVLAPRWDNGAIVDAGSITLGKGSQGAAGLISGANSFVGQSTNDAVGTGTVRILADGRAVVGSSKWTANGVNAAGRVDIFGEQDGMNFYINPMGTSTFLAGDLAALLGSGQNLTLEANNDITVRAALNVDNPNGNGGKLSLRAGRNIVLQAGIATDNGDLDMVANDPGSIQVNRESGPATLSMTGTASIAAGSGTVTLAVRDGPGGAGEITLRDVSAGRISAINEGSATGAAIVLNGQLAATAADPAAIELAGRRFTNNAGSAALSVPNGSWRVWSVDPAADDRGGLAYDFKQYNARRGDALQGIGNAFAYSVAPAITASLTGTTVKSYDGTTAAMLSAGNYIVTGALDGDIVTLGNATAGTYSGADVGNTLVTVSGLTLSATDAAGQRPVYGLSLPVTQLSANIGTINPFKVQLSATRDYDGSTTIVPAILNMNVLPQGQQLDLSGSGTIGNASVAVYQFLSNVSLVSNANPALGNAANYVLDNGNHTINIVRAPLILSSNPAYSKIYDGTLSAPANYAVSTGGTQQAANQRLDGGTFAFTDPNAGSNKVVKTSDVRVLSNLNGVDTTNNYLITYVDNTTSTINPFPVRLSGTRSYDGTTNVPTLSMNALPNNESLGLSGNGSLPGRNADSYSSVSGLSLVSNPVPALGNADNYILANNQHAITITPASLSVSTGAVAKTYDGTTNANGAPVAVNGTQLYGGDTLSGGIFTFDNRNAGTGKTVNVASVTVNDGNGGNNYSVSYVPNTAGSIAPAALTISTLPVSKTYDGSTGAAGTPVAANGTQLYGDTLSGGTFTFDNRNVGTGKTVNVADVSVNDGNGGRNYTVSYASNSAGSIAPADLVVSTSPVSKIYDGTTAAAGTAVATGGTQLVGGDTLSGGAFAFDNRNAGSGKTITVDAVTVNDGNGGANYAVSYAPNTAGSITPAALVVTTAPVSKSYDGTTAAAGTAVATGGTRLYAGDALSGGSFAFDTKDTGSGKTVSVGSVTVNDGNGGANYHLSFVPNTASSITAAGLVLSAAPVMKTYDGTTAANGSPVVVSGTLYGGDAVSGGSYAFDDKNAGTGKTVNASGISVNDGNGGANYSVSYLPNTTSEIRPAPLTLTTAAVNKVYDGTVTANGSPVIVSGSLYGGDTFGNGSYAFDNRHAGAGKTVNGAVTINDGNGGANYAVTQVPNTNSSITPASLVVSTLPVTKTYDGSTTASGTPVAVDGTQLYGNDTLTGGSVAFDNRNAGTGKHVSVRGVSINDGNQGGNYLVSYVDNTAGTVTAAPLVLTTTAVVKPYDGNVSAAGTPIVSQGVLYSGDTLSGGNYAFLDPTIGTGKTVTASDITVNDGNGGSNYSVAYVSNTSSSITAPAAVTDASAQAGAAIAMIVADEQRLGADRPMPSSNSTRASWCVLRSPACAAAPDFPVLVKAGGILLPPGVLPR